MNNNQKKSTEIKPAKGGPRPGAGRPKGAVNKATADIKAAAAEYSESALTTLAAIMQGEHPAAARVAAANAILDRAHGKPKQSMEVDADVRASVTQIVRKIVDPND